MVYNLKVVQEWITHFQWQPCIDPKLGRMSRSLWLFQSLRNPPPQKSALMWFGRVRPSYSIHRISTGRPLQTLDQQLYSHHRSKLFWKLHHEVQHDRFCHYNHQCRRFIFFYCAKNNEGITNIMTKTVCK